MSEKDLFCMKRTNIVVSRICNLNCKLCASYSPYNTITEFPDISSLLVQVKRYFNIVDYVELLSISGGEPLLYKGLPDLLEGLLSYSERIGRLEIITNGTIVPNDRLIDVVKKFGNTFSRFLVDNYGEHLSTHVKEIDEVLEKNNIPRDIRNNSDIDPHCGGWVDFGLADEVKHTSKEALELFSRCVQPQKFHFCFEIDNGNLCPCSVVFRRLTLGDKVDYNDYINLMDDNLSVEEQRNKISNIYNASCLETCRYCNGFDDNSPRFIPAEQFTAEEIRKIRAKK